MKRNMMFSGGIPADGPEKVFELLNETVGDRALCWPDGETNPERRGWIAGVAENVLAVAPCFEPDEVIVDRPDGGHYQQDKMLRIKPGATVDLKGRLPYAKDAIASYKIFKRMQSEGRIPQNIRFQVAIPGAHDVITICFARTEEWPVLFKAWQEAVQEECRRMLEVIPADELCVQIDFCTEMCHIGGAWAKLLSWVPDNPEQELFDELTSPEYIQGHIAALPEEVRLGFHICCGTSPHFPVQPLDDISLPVRLTNAIQKSADGRVDYFHLPAMHDSDEAYFAPLADLNIGNADIYLGVECNDGVELMDRRVAAAHKYLSDFGVAHYCGYFWNKAIMPDLLRTLAQGSDDARELMGD
ncbi:hypothetical protein OZX74_03405 [Bifidobacterium sp. ESL0798]|uniref:hypothetical protein n=1 Tax=Bifidobacterium sp. ESL0798 TaxID=2983235 RepID=UPI0023F83568|nr:hypothetical protein [Bifidobacterium sp. ESL0798]WEV74582.1 hypothetical protein OZX74_03405 [Bifidobacterium sp. ESL0798]